jgi:septum site-determining protein MinC
MAMSGLLECGQSGWGRPHVLRLPPGDSSALAAAAAVLADAALQNALPPRGPLKLEAGLRELKAAELQQLVEMLAEAGLELVSVASDAGGTRVAAAALGLPWEPLAPWPDRTPADGERAAADATSPPDKTRPLTIQQGTLRSGDHLDVAGSLLVLGDVNPGARISATGHVLVWGQLRGVAHAGCKGDRTARITALQLRPVQLRIAELVARGPADSPPIGLAEQAVIVDGAIAIQPAQPQWPLATGRVPAS